MASKTLKRLLRFILIPVGAVRDKDKRVHFINLEIRGMPDDYKVSLGKAKKTQG
jgi:hypothetical protein